MEYRSDPESTATGPLTLDLDPEVLHAPHWHATAGLGQRIRQARKKKGWTMAELARRSGVSKDNVWHVERDLVDPRSSRVVAIARALGVSADWLLGL